MVKSEATGVAGLSREQPRPSGRRDIGRFAVALAVALYALSAFDLAITEIATVHLGAVEVNPLMEPLLGTPWAMVLKLGIPAAVVFAARKVQTRVVALALGAAVVGYAGVALFSIAQIVIVFS